MTDPLVSTGWLAEHLGAPDVVVIDGSWFLPDAGRDPAKEFAAAHIPGAVFFDIDAISDRAISLPHMLPTPEAFRAQVRRLGVGERSRIVVYDSHGLFSAPRVWWSFRAMGHAETWVLDGGLPKWKVEGRPLESGAPAPREGDFVARLDPRLVRDLEAVRAALTNKSEQVIDARSAARFQGLAPEPRAGLRAGHMPGAYNLPWSELVAPGDILRSGTELRQAFETAGVDLGRPIVTSCGSGVSAALLALALARLGRGDIAVYDGSWSEWGSRLDTPVVTG